MKFSKKDQSFILLIIAILVIFYSVYSLFSNLFLAATFHRSDVGNVIINEDASKDSQQWFNTSRSLEASDFKNRVVLLNFWSEDCVDCNFSLLKIRRLEQQYGNRLTIIGVYSKKSKKNSSEIIQSILKNNIRYPVVDDFNLKIKRAFGIKNLPSLVLINPRGNIVKSYVTEKKIIRIDSDIKRLVSKFKYQLNSESLPLFFEKNSAATNVLSFPSKLEYTKLFNYKSRKIPAIFISNSGKNNIVITNLAGEIILKIGSEIGGFKDGNFDEASFNSPRGLLYDEGVLYVADTGNNALREINFETNKVTTLIGSGKRGELIGKKVVKAKDIDLSDPSGVEFFPDRNNIVIVNSGTHQLLTYNLKSQNISVLAGDGTVGNNDGKYPNNSLSQISDLTTYNKNLYVTDMKISALRVLDKSGNIKTLINGKKSGALSRPSAIMVDDTGVYIADNDSQVIKKYDISSEKVTTFISGKGKSSSNKSFSTQLDSPSSIVSALGNFYIADSNNNRILSVSRGNLKFSLLDVIPALKLSKEGFLQYLPNLQKFDSVSLAAGKKILVEMNVKKGWKINEKGPSFINLLDLKSKNKADLLASFDWNDIMDKNIKLPKLSSGKKYVLQGVIYYCEDKKNSLCYVKSYEQKLQVGNGEKGTKIIVELDY